MVKYLPDLIKIDYKTYHEPFLGGGSVFFYLNPRVAFLSDANEELIDAFEGNVDNQSHETWKYLRVTKNTKKRYEVIRAELMRRMGE